MRSIFAKFRDLLIAGLLLLLAEGALHTQAQRLGGIKVGDFRSDVIEECIQKAEAQDSLDVAVVGSSVTSAIDTTSLGQQAADRFVLYSADTHGTLRISQDIVLANTHPRYLVYVISPRDVNTHSEIGQLNQSLPDIDRYKTSRLRYQASRWFQKNLFLYRYRNHLDAFIDRSEQVPPNEESLESTVSPAFATFTPSERWEEDLIALNEASKAQSTELILFYLPCNPSERATTPEFQKEAAAWSHAISDWSIRHHVRYFNSSSTVAQADHFRDTHHLNESGTELATMAFATWLEQPIANARQRELF